MGAVGVKAKVHPFFCYANTTATTTPTKKEKATTTATKIATAIHDCNHNRNPKPGSHPYLSSTLKPDNLMTRFEEIITKIIEFRTVRECEQFNDAKYLALALMLEAA